MATETASGKSSEKLENVMAWLGNVETAAPTPADPELDRQAEGVVTHLLAHGVEGSPRAVRRQ